MTTEGKMTRGMMTQFMVKSAKRAFIVNVGNIPNTKLPKKLQVKFLFDLKIMEKKNEADKNERILV